MEAGVQRKAVCDAERLLGTAIWGASRQWHASQYALVADALADQGDAGQWSFVVHAVRCDVPRLKELVLVLMCCGGVVGVVCSPLRPLGRSLSRRAALRDFRGPSRPHTTRSQRRLDIGGAYTYARAR